MEGKELLQEAYKIADKTFDKDPNVRCCSLLCFALEKDPVATDFKDTKIFSKIIKQIKLYKKN